MSFSNNRWIPVSVLSLETIYFSYFGKWMLVLISALLCIGLIKRIEALRKLAVVYFVVSLIVLVFIYFPPNIEASQSVFWDMDIYIKICLLLISEAVMVFSLFQIKQKFVLID